MAIGARFASVLSAAGRGADWAWAELYRDLSPAVLRYLANHGAHEPEDLLGECFVHVVRNVGNFEGDESAFRSWVFAIAHSRLIDHWRKQGRSRTDQVGDDEYTQLVTGLADHTAPDREILERAAVLELLASLAPLPRAVILLRVVDQFSVKETATILGRREGAIRVLQSRAIKTLQRALATHPGNPEVDRLLAGSVPGDDPCSAASPTSPSRENLPSTPGSG
ncbi:MAG TPA: RNA polymerase sigma factor [Propionicimonas sp.]|jgi:RNA polymerase sigma-70 factor (ECF subfamily)